MTDSEFLGWTKRLFVEYPSVWEWIQKNSPDPKGTQAHWRQQLRDYSAAECHAVLDAWATTSQHPFAAYERDKLPMIVRSVIDKRRDKQRKRERLAEQRREYEGVRRGGDPRQPTPTVLDSPMQAAVVECIPLHKRFLAGEIGEYEYERFRDAIIDRHLGDSNG